MGRSRVALVIALLAASTLAPSKVHSAERLKLATGTSTVNSGLLEALIPPFERRYRLRVDILPVGTGKALKLGRMGDVDVVFVHARAAEDRFVAQGYGVNRRDVMYNEFVVVGPPQDPANLKIATTLDEALRSLAGGGAPFLSRGDDSGTHKKERQLWASAGITPAGRWYLETGRGMGHTLIAASEKQGYALSDRGTYLAMQTKLELEVLFEDDEKLYNPYGIIAVNPARHPHTNYVMALALIGWVTSPEGQRIISGYRKGGKALFHPMAVQPPGDGR